MKKIIALVSVLVLCMACVSTAFATVTEFEYDIVAARMDTALPQFTPRAAEVPMPCLRSTPTRSMVHL